MDQDGQMAGIDLGPDRLEGGLGQGAAGDVRDDHHPGSSEIAGPAELLHGAIWVSKNKYVDNTNIIGDYYFLQAMNRYLAT